MVKTLAALVGWLAPPKLTGRVLLRQEIKKQGLDVGTLSDDCVNEIVETDISSAKFFRKKNEPWKSRFVYEIENSALTIAMICHGAEFYSYSRIHAGREAGEAYVMLDILAKHHPERFSMENLEKTQKLFVETR